MSNELTKTYRSKEEWMEAFAEYMVRETSKIVEPVCEKSSNIDKGKMVGKLVCAQIKKGLKEILNKPRPSMTKEALVDTVDRDIKEFRRNMASEIGEAFSKAMSDFCGIEIDYVCFIDIVMEMKSKTNN